jgi:hypothetical protein
VYVTNDEDSVTGPAYTTGERALITFMNTAVATQTIAVDNISLSSSATTPTTTTTTVPPTTTTTVPPGPFVPTPTVNPAGGIANVASNFSLSPYALLDPSAVDSSFADPSGNFRTHCEFSHVGRWDPIVSPGVAGQVGHGHMFFGNTSITSNSVNYNSLRTTGGSTCAGGGPSAGINRTGYWMPWMETTIAGTPKLVRPDYFNLYYKCFGPNGSSVTRAQQEQAIANCGKLPSGSASSGSLGFPNGLRMIAGDLPNNTNEDLDNNPATSSFHWSCSSSSSTSLTIPTSCPNPGDQLVGTIVFPMCWDGVSLDSANHRSHMSYKVDVSGNGSGSRIDCPTSHPVQLPTITEFVYFTVPSGGSLSGWKLSCDMNTTSAGSCLHADWYGAWDNTAQNAYVANCIQLFKSCNAPGNLGNNVSLSSVNTFWPGFSFGPTPGGPEYMNVP